MSRRTKPTPGPEVKPTRPLHTTQQLDPIARATSSNVTQIPHVEAKKGKRDQKPKVLSKVSIEVTFPHYPTSRPIAGADGRLNDWEQLPDQHSHFTSELHHPPRRPAGEVRRAPSQDDEEHKDHERDHPSDSHEALGGNERRSPKKVGGRWERSTGWHHAGKKGRADGEKEKGKGRKRRGKEELDYHGWRRMPKHMPRTQLSAEAASSMGRNSRRRRREANKVKELSRRERDGSNADRREKGRNERTTWYSLTTPIHAGGDGGDLCWLASEWMEMPMSWRSNEISRVHKDGTTERREGRWMTRGGKGARAHGRRGEGEKGRGGYSLKVTRHPWIGVGVEEYIHDFVPTPLRRRRVQWRFEDMRVERCTDVKAVNIMATKKSMARRA
ncbi:hypothetical protein DFP72DRAFT_852624 [Ephemerocybe angulata]|uniref:Uncharacterized protein n=1 Tax=Ephemerocybe angulata TaxID=980116 RepID=A0A8H6HMR9_9AGAR|nr:hypothetical protein DFP72DRAFT_852624 [Tulosesus angulatus]